MTKKNIHDAGIDRRVKQIWSESRDRNDGLLCVAKNVDYKKGDRTFRLHGELDILKIYSNGVFGIEEVKSNIGCYSKAKLQLTRAKNIFKYYTPSLAVYIANVNDLLRLNY